MRLGNSINEYQKGVALGLWVWGRGMPSKEAGGLL